MIEQFLVERQVCERMILKNIFSPHYNLVRCSQYFHSDPCAGFGVGEGMVMVGEIVATGGCHGVELVVGELFPEVFS